METEKIISMDEFNWKPNKSVIAELIRQAVFDTIKLRIKYDAMVRAGFSEHQILELMKTGESK